MKPIVKSAVRLLAGICVIPVVLSYRLRSSVMGKDLALEGSSQWLSLLPGLPGVYLRNAFLRSVLEECHPTAHVGFGTLFSKAGARLGPHCYIGPNCHLGLVHIERDVLIAAGVHIPSGAHIHGTDNLDQPIREQTGQISVVRIGAGSWIGAASVVMADVGQESIVGAGAVVTRPIPQRAIAVGNPARVIRSRESQVHENTGQSLLVEETTAELQPVLNGREG